VARPAKSLQERVRDRSFLARRHGGLLAGPLTNHPELREIQAAYQAAETDRQRRLFALDFEQNVRTARPGKRVGGLRQGGFAPADGVSGYTMHQLRKQPQTTCGERPAQRRRRRDSCGTSP